MIGLPSNYDSESHYFDKILNPQIQSTNKKFKGLVALDPDAIWVDSLNGNDEDGNGKANKPFATLNRALKENDIKQIWIIAN